MNKTITTKRVQDPVLAEVRRIKEQIAAEHGYDVRRIAEDAMKRQKQHPDRIVDLSRRKQNRVPVTD